MNSFQIRQKYLDFFARNGHTIVPSSSLIPAQDPTLLFTNAGMNQFKDLFLGKEKRSYTRAASSQKCVRAGGKHNDLDAVGFTERHLTFFEMLGNFSFGDYFKKEAISYAWEFLTKDMQLPASDLYISVFREDDEAYNLWHEMIGVPTNRIIRLGEKDNFWQMGDTGPCGPCTEIYVDRGADKGCQSATCAPGCDCSRFTEIWNLVFMQFDRQTDGQLKPLAATGVDTGMGLERLCMIVQGKHDVYQTDLFQALIAAIEQLTGVSYQASAGSTKAAFHVLGDHIRSSSLLIADGCSPSNDGRGYVLRKIIRRAALFTQKLSSDLNVFVKLAEVFISQLGTVYPELLTSKTLIINLLSQELTRFAHNLEHGQVILEKYISENKQNNKTEMSGEQIFKLYDTYGFPPELTRVMAHEQGLTLDMDCFETEMKKQQEQSGKKVKRAENEFIITEHISTKFVGYETTEVESKILFAHYAGDHAWIITEESPFYVESGGQVNDTGTVSINHVQYKVIDLQKAGDTHNPAIVVKLALPAGAVIDSFVPGDSALCSVNPAIRANTVKNHTATHMLQAALMQVLGPQIKQAGSLVCDSYMRFDFNHHEALSKQQIETIEAIVNQKIMEDIPTAIFNTTLADAKTKGVISFFGEKYNPEKVRVVQIPGFSAELCGGTHARSTGIIGCFKITSDTALSAGTRRLVAVTGPEALKLFQTSYSIVKKLSEDFKAKPEEVGSAVQKLQQHYAEHTSTIKQLKKQLCKAQLPGWLNDMRMIKEVPTLFLNLDDTSADELRAITQELEKAKPGFYVIVGKDTAADRYSFIAHVAKQYEGKIDLKALSQFLKDRCDWRCGGSASTIQGGGTSLPAGFAASLEKWLQ